VQKILKSFHQFEGCKKFEFMKSALVLFEIMIDLSGEVYTINGYGESVLDQALKFKRDIIEEYLYITERIAPGMTDGIMAMYGIYELLKSCDGKRKKAYNYLRDIWIP
jgi:hypothetical protein